MNKDLALIYEYSKAPQALKDAAKAAKESSAKLANKTEQKVVLDAEIKTLSADYEKAFNDFQRQLENWNPVEGA